MKKISPLKLWSCVFALWGLFLSGVFANFVGSPGIIQAVRLGSLLHSKRVQLNAMRADLLRLQADASQLEAGSGGASNWTSARKMQLPFA